MQTMAWEYEDARGVTRVGYVVKTYDYGGTDVGQLMHDATTGETTVLSGERLRRARCLNRPIVFHASDVEAYQKARSL